MEKERYSEGGSFEEDDLVLVGWFLRVLVFAIGHDKSY